MAARLRAALDETATKSGWPIEWRLKFLSRQEKGAAEDGLRDFLELAPHLIKDLERATKLLRGHGGVGTKGHAFEQAAGLARMYAKFARFELEGRSSTPSQSLRGRKGDSIRTRVAAYCLREARFGMADEKPWPSPPARDLALLAICHGCEVLPETWQTMTPAALIDAERRSMAPYLRSHGKK